MTAYDERARIMLRPRTRLTRWIAAITAVVAVATVGVFMASPAHAEPFAGLYEGFDNVPDDRWDIDSIPGQSAVTMGRNSLAFSNGTAAQLDSRTWTNAVAMITRTITADPNTNFDQCGISVYLRRLAVEDEPHPMAHVSMRIRAGGPTGAIRSSMGVTIYDTNGYGRWSFSNNFSYPTMQLTLEISAFRGIVLVDDLRISCGTR
jgi:hypothetical protein